MTVAATTTPQHLEFAPPPSAEELEKLAQRQTIFGSVAVLIFDLAHASMLQLGADGKKNCTHQGYGNSDGLIRGERNLIHQIGQLGSHISSVTKR